MPDDRPQRLLTGTTGLARSREVLWRMAPGYLVLARLDDEVRRAEGPAPEVWALLDQPVTFDDLAAILADRYDVAAAAVRADLEPFLAELVAEGFVSEVDVPRQEPNG